MATTHNKSILDEVPKFNRLRISTDILPSYPSSKLFETTATTSFTNYSPPPSIPSSPSSLSPPCSPTTDFIPVIPSSFSPLSSPQNSLTFDKLSSPILIAILLHITSFDFFHSTLPFISKRFRDLLPRLSRHFHRSYYSSTSSFSSSSSCSSSSFSTSPNPISRKLSLELSATFSHLDSTNSASLLSIIYTKWEPFTFHITTIDVSHSKWDDEALQVFSVCCPNLITFLGQQCDNITSEGLQHLARSCLELQLIDVSNSKNLQWSVDSICLPPDRFTIDVPEGDDDPRIIVAACHDPNESSFSHSLSLLSIVQVAEKVLLRVHSNSIYAFHHSYATYTVNYIRLKQSVIQNMKTYQRDTLNYLLDSSFCSTIEQSRDFFLEEEGEEEEEEEKG